MFVTNRERFDLGRHVHSLHSNCTNDRWVDVRVMKALQSVERIIANDHCPKRRDALHFNSLTIPECFSAKAKRLQGW